jgi:hypothetical protein
MMLLTCCYITCYVLCAGLSLSSGGETVQAVLQKLWSSPYPASTENCLHLTA